MSVTVKWQSKTWELDPCELSQLQLSRIEEKTGFAFFRLMEGVVGLDSTALRAVCWAGDPATPWEEADAPPTRLVVEHLGELGRILGGLGKAASAATAEVDGLDGSPRSMESAPTSTTA